MEERVQEFILYLREVKQLSNNTYISYHQDLEKFLVYLHNNGINSLQKISDVTMNSYILYLEKNNFSTATIARNIVVLKAFFLHLIKHHVILVDPTERLKAPRVEKKPRQTLSVEEVNALLNAPDINSIKGIRDKAMFELLYATGIKASELVELKVENVNFAYNILTCHNAKGERLIPFGNDAKEALDLYLKEARQRLAGLYDHCFLFVNQHGHPMTRQGFWKIIKGYAGEIGIETITPQILRNSFAKHLIANGASVNTVGDMLGYSDHSLAYMYTTDKAARVRDEYMRAHPRA